VDLHAAVSLVKPGPPVYFQTILDRYTQLRMQRGEYASRKRGVPVAMMRSIWTNGVAYVSFNVVVLTSRVQAHPKYF
jgi:hypothetical protein